ncbi:hypothetical protein U1Q18_018871, partial [Sarracenia purpurea var. burkii]
RRSRSEDDGGAVRVRRNISGGFVSIITVEAISEVFPVHKRNGQYFGAAAFFLSITGLGLIGEKDRRRFQKLQQFKIFDEIRGGNRRRRKLSGGYPVWSPELQWISDGNRFSEEEELRKSKI